jgi:hypothetical protein
MNMKLVHAFSMSALGFLLGSVEGNNVDRFNYGTQNQGIVDNQGDPGTDFGQPAWDSVTCNDLGQCVSGRSSLDFTRTRIGFVE